MEKNKRGGDLGCKQPFRSQEGGRLLAWKRIALAGKSCGRAAENDKCQLAKEIEAMMQLNGSNVVKKFPGAAKLRTHLKRSGEYLRQEI